MKELYYSAKEVKNTLGISAQTLKRWKDDGKLRTKILSVKKVWYLKEDVDNLLN